MASNDFYVEWQGLMVLRKVGHDVAVSILLVASDGAVL